MNTDDLFDLATDPGSNAGKQHWAERRMLTAVLRQAMDDMIDYRFDSDPNARRIHDAAAGWIFSTATQDADDHLSFSRTCDLLGLEPSYIRQLVKRLMDPDPPLRVRAA